MNDYVRNSKGEEEGQLHNLSVICSSNDPIMMKQSSMRSGGKLRTSIKKNDTWSLVNLPQVGKEVSVKWIYKTKCNEKGEVEKYKVRLVAKGYSR